MSAVAYSDFSDPRLDGFVGRTLDEFHTPGLAIAVVHGKQTWAQGYGVSDRDGRIPVTPHSLFFTASTTKSFTAAMAAHVIGERTKNPSNGNPINWATPISDLVRDDFVLQNDYATKHVTIEDALSHRTGMPRHDLISSNDDVSIQDQVRAMRHLPLHDELRSKWEYCNIMYIAVAYALAKAVGLDGTRDDIKVLAQQWIWAPLGMNETFYDLDDAKQRVYGAGNDADSSTPMGLLNMARGYYYESDTHRYFKVPWKDMPPSKGNGGMISNVLDYTIWLRHLMSHFQPPIEEASYEEGRREARLGTSRLTEALSKDAVTAMTTPRMVLETPLYPIFSPVSTYGLGLFVHSYKGNVVWHHSGAITGYMTNMLMLPEHEWAVVTMQNSYSYAQDIVVWKLVDDFLESKAKADGSKSYKRWSMADYARQQEKRKREELETKDIQRRLFPDVSVESSVQPALPLQAYEGTYQHPAYHNLVVSIQPPPSLGDPNGSRTGDLVPNLYVTPASSLAFMDTKATLYHVSGEVWWAYQQSGPRQWIADTPRKVKFEIGVDGKIRSMRYQAEAALEAEAEWGCFEKLS